MAGQSGHNLKISILLKEKAGGGNGEEVYIISFSLAAQYPYFGGYNGLSGLVRLLAGSSNK